ncbi:DUF2293 domain-containing protein [Amycolatopsis acidiphila]|uniref:DUF2293 domain-containing protein n=1 Tax=Amycolatopsis acidiphila TaxID=715473 RepID=A0A557ZYN8_9PSEU|nr:DUF2293 domain-containing protein [Amycolatopsis acidiphila]TVT17123.1 DUF2293 domain-containing protein [Amycolatopsis acidiphila]UIJ58313.1 DUF2293 domain-containing protein [Amycolatopsis acidiphila]GHG95668.1 hypothetical protein GCM10017788_74340 [Amycolatopsis acidiphila]
MSDQPKLRRRVADAAEAVLRKQKYVAPVDVLVGLRWLKPAGVEDWRLGRRGPLLDALPVDGVKVLTAFEHLHDWARERGLRPSEAVYLAGTRDRRPLVFAEDEALQRVFRTHWVSPELSDKQREKLEARQNQAPDLVVLSPHTDWTCTGCGIRSAAGEFQYPEDDRPLCLSCADFDHLVFLPSGNAALSRRAKKESTLAVLVTRFNKRRKRYERQGILVEEAALERAEGQCLADEDVRARRRERDAVRRAAQDVEFQAAMAGEIRRLFPGCGAERAQAIAEHAGTRGSGRVGRSAAGRALDDEAVRLAVVASIRHEDTDYDAMLMAGVPRAEARDRIRPGIDRVLARWERG